MHSLAVLLLFLVAAPVSAQSFMSAVQEAASSQESGRHREAGIQFERAYSLSGGDPVLLYVAAGERAEAGELSRAMDDLENVVRSGWAHVDPMESDSALLRLHEMARWEALIAEARERYASFNLPLRSELLSLAEEDQRNRSGIQEVLAEHGAGSPEADSAFALMTALDEPLQRRLKEIVAEHGWPGRSLVADDGAHAAWLLVQHADSAYQERVLPLLMAAAETGEARKGDAALLLDRVLMHRGEPQVYGSQLSFSGRELRLHPIADEAEVDERRKAMLLEPLSEYLKQQGMDYSPPESPRASRQNPSPMVETARAHTRVASLDYPMRTIDAGLPRNVSLFVSDDTGDVDLLIHFMGAEYIPAQAAVSHGAVAVVNLGAGSGAYERPFLVEDAFERLLGAIRAEIGGAARIRRIDLSAFSAGYGAVRAILSKHTDRVDGILLLDALHTGYVPEGTVLAEGGRLDTSLLAPFVRFAERAVAGEKSFILTHSEIFPGTFASTTETSDYLIDALGLTRTAALEWGPAGMQQVSGARSGGLTILGFAGNTAPDHVDHLHGMAEFLRLLHAK